MKRGIWVLFIVGLFLAGFGSCPYKFSDTPCQLSISPGDSEVHPGESVQYSAIPCGSSGEIIWSFFANNSGGTIDENGYYTAGEVPGAIDIIQAYEVETDNSAFTTVRVFCPISVSGPDAVVTGETAEYSASGGAAPYSWSVDQPDIASIDESTGLLSAEKAGSVIVTVSDAHGCSASVTVDIVCPTIAITGPNELLENNSAVYTASGGTEPYIWWINNTDYGTMDENSGLFTGLVPGDVGITVMDAYGCIAETRINITCLTITVSGPSWIATGATAIFTATGGNTPYSWSVDDSGIATIDSVSGELTALSHGRVTVTGTDRYGCVASKEAYIISFDSKLYTIDSDGDTLPDDIESGETDPHQWVTGGTLDTARISSGHRNDTEVFNRAYDRYKHALSYISGGYCNYTFLDSNGNGVIETGDAELMSPDGITCENGETGYLKIRGVVPDNGPKFFPEFIVTAYEHEISSGEVGVPSVYKEAKIEARLKYASYLDFSRFVLGDIAFETNLTVNGDLYVGGTLTVNYGDVFKGDVYAHNIVNASNAIFEGNVYLNFPRTLDLDVDWQISYFYNQALANGWIIKSANDRACLRNSLQETSATDNWLKLDDFQGLDTANPKYVGDTCTHNLPANFNGIIFWDDANTYDIHVSGSLGTVAEVDGLTHGKSMVIISRAHNIVLDYGIRMGADSLNQPINLGFIVTNANKQLLFAQNGPIFWENHAAIMITKKPAPSWTRPGSSSSSVATDTAYRNRMGGGGSNLYPATENVCGGMAATCMRDLDGSGSIEVLDWYGWPEKNLTEAKTNTLFQYGPMITMAQGSRGMWYWSFAAPNNGATLVYKENPNIAQYPPPFPVIDNFFRLVSMKVIRDEIPYPPPDPAITISGPDSIEATSSATYSASGGQPPYHWFSYSPEIVEIDENSGHLTPVTIGDGIIIAVDESDNFSVYLVSVVCPDITISGPDQIAVGNTGDYSASGGKSPYIWSLDQTFYSYYVTIDSNTGQVLALHTGSLFIDATDENGCTAKKHVQITP